MSIHLYITSVMILIKFLFKELQLRYNPTWDSNEEIAPMTVVIHLSLGNLTKSITTNWILLKKSFCIFAGFKRTIDGQRTENNYQITKNQNKTKTLFQHTICQIRYVVHTPTHTCTIAVPLVHFKNWIKFEQ